MNTKKILSVLLLGAMCVGFVSCENDEPDVNDNGNGTEQTDPDGNGSGNGGGTTDPVTPENPDSSSTETPTYTVTLSVNDEAMGEVTGAGEYKEGAEVTLEAVANEGYKFVKWSDENTENPRTITVTANITLTANFIDRFNGHAYVDLGLPSGTLWATCNVGATSPEEYGNYYAWGEVEPKTYYNWSSEGDYKWGVYNGSDTNYGMTKYNKTDGKTVLDPEDDAATVNWGGDWRMPTVDEIEELYSNCTREWTTDYNGTGIAGRIVTSDINGNSVFLPAAGYRFNSSLNDAGSYGGYWSSSLGTSNPGNAYSLDFGSGYYVWDNSYRYFGLSVRPVCSSR